MRLLPTLLAAACLVLGAPAARAILIDDFSVDQTATVRPDDPPAWSVVSAIRAGLGGREVFLQRFSGTGAVSFTSAGGIGAFGFGPDADGRSHVWWDGLRDGALTHLLGADLTDGGASGLLRIVVRSELAGPLTISIHTNAGRVSRADVVTPGLGIGAAFTTLLIPFTSFAVELGSGADFADVGAIVVTAPSAGGALEIDRIDTVPVPEPATALLLALGVAAAARFAGRRPR
jgi:hypothetical protein